MHPCLVGARRGNPPRNSSKPFRCKPKLSVETAEELFEAMAGQQVARFTWGATKHLRGAFSSCHGSRMKSPGMEARALHWVSTLGRLRVSSPGLLDGRGGHSSQYWSDANYGYHVFIGIGPGQRRKRLSL